MGINVHFSIVNITGYERTLHVAPFNKERLGQTVVLEPDYLIVQLGKNVNREVLKVNEQIFEEGYANLLVYIPLATKNIALLFWPESLKH